MFCNLYPNCKKTLNRKRLWLTYVTFRAKKPRIRLEAINRDNYEREINEKDAAQRFLLTLNVKSFDAPEYFRFFLLNKGQKDMIKYR